MKRNQTKDMSNSIFWVLGCIMTEKLRFFFENTTFKKKNFGDRHIRRFFMSQLKCKVVPLRSIGHVLKRSGKYAQNSKIK